MKLKQLGYILTLTSAVMMGACSQTRTPPPGALAYSTMDPSVIKGLIQTSGTEFDKHITYKGPHIYFPSTSRHKSYFFLRSWKPKSSKSLTHQIYVHKTYRGDNRFYFQATNSDAKKFEFTSINTDVIDCSSSGCDMSETFGLTISDSVLRRHFDEDYRFQIKSKSGHSEVLTLPANYIKTYIKSINTQ